MATKSAGRVSIRVLPDSTRFKKDLETSLRRIERQLQAKIQAELVLSRESLAKLKKQIESLAVKIKPTIELNITAAEIAEMKAKIEATRPKVTIQLDTSEAASRISALSRTRRVRMVPFLDNAATARFVSKMKGLTGLNVLGDMFREGSEFMSNIDRNAVSLAKTATTITAAVAGVTTLLGGMVLIGQDLASLGGIGILAPAFVTGLGVGIGVLIAAMKDMKTVLADLGPVFTRLQDIISNSFWKEAATPIREMVRSIEPILGDGLKGTATELGGMFAIFATTFKDQLLRNDNLKVGFERMNAAIHRTQDAVAPLTRAFVTLGMTGTKYFGRFSDWIVKLSEQFDNFIKRSAEDGSLDRWVENAIQGFKDLGKTIRGTVRILNSVGQAARRAGVGGLGELGDSLNNAADVMNSERFQRTLTTLFRGANEAVSGIGRGLRELGPAIESAAPSIERVFGTFGQIAEKVGGMLASIISNPTVQAGLETFFGSINQSLENLKPSIQPLGDSLGGLLTILGQVLEQVSVLVNSFTILFTPALDKVAEAFGRIAFTAGPEIERVMRVLAPLVNTLVDTVLPPLENLLKTSLKAIGDLIVKFSPEFNVTVEKLGTALGKVFDAATKAVPLVQQFIDKIGTPLLDALSAASDSIGIFADRLGRAFEKMDAGDGNGAVLEGLVGIFEGVGNFLIEAWNVQIERFEKGTDFGTQNMNFWKEFGKRFVADFKLTNDWVNTELNPKVNEFFNGIGEEIKKAWDNMWNGLQKWYDGVKTEFQKFMASLLGFGDPDNDGFGTSGGSVGGKGMAPGAKIFPKMLDQEAEGTWLETFKSGITTKMAELWVGLQENQNTGLIPLAATFALKWQEMGTNVDTFKTNAMTNYGLWALDTQTKTNETMGSSAGTIAAKTLEMGEKIQGFVDTYKPIWETGFQLMRDKTTNMMGEAATNTGTSTATMATDMGIKVIQMKQDWDTNWNIIKDKVRTAWEDMKEKVRTGVDSAATEAGKLGDKAKTSMGDLSGKLVSSGEALVRGFAAGMDNNRSLVESAAIGLAAAVAKFMPHSPAKSGPLSGRGYTTHSGRALVSDFASGIMDNMAKVRNATAAVAEAAQLGANLDSNLDLDNEGVVIDRRQVTIQTYNPVAEPTSRTIEKAANTLRMAKAI